MTKEERVRQYFEDKEPYIVAHCMYNRLIRFPDIELDPENHNEAVMINNLSSGPIESDGMRMWITVGYRDKKPQEDA